MVDVGNVNRTFEVVAQASGQSQHAPEAQAGRVWGAFWSFAVAARTNWV